MTKKPPNKSASAASAKPRKSPPAAAPIDPYTKLLCQVAGGIVGSVMQNPSPSLKSSTDFATVGLDVAREILRVAGVAGPDQPDQPTTAD